MTNPCLEIEAPDPRDREIAVLQDAINLYVQNHLTQQAEIARLTRELAEERAKVARLRRLQNNAHLTKIEELESCLRWYVEEDDVNMTQPGNEYWIEGKQRAMRALGMEEG
jgi:hypothetical protein